MIDRPHSLSCQPIGRPSHKLHSSSTNAMTTFYIEEVTDEESTNDEFSHDADVSEINSNPNPKHSPLRIEHLKPCPYPIGGGSSLTIIGGKAFVFGGCDRTGTSSSSLHVYDFEKSEWTCDIDCKGNPPSARFGHSAIAFDSKLYIYGGQGIATSGGSIFDDPANLECFSSMYYLNIVTMTWGEVDASAHELWPKRRNSHSAVLLGGKKLVVFGGANEEDGPTNDLWSYDFELNTWFDFTSGNAPCAREMHSLTGDDDRNCVYLLGGRKEDGTVCQDFWVYHLGE